MTCAFLSLCLTSTQLNAREGTQTFTILNECIGVIVAYVSGMALHVHHDHASTPPLVLCLIEVPIDSCCLYILLDWLTGWAVDLRWAGCAPFAAHIDFFAASSYSCTNMGTRVCEQTKPLLAYM